MNNKAKLFLENGFLLIDKPTGISSAKVVSTIKHKFNIKKIGHAGTLDPLASGLLVLMINRATKLFPLFLGENKLYDVKLKFGEARDTYDAEGEITHTSIYLPSENELKAILKDFIGEQYQEVPAFSAVKRNGTSLYKLARKGQKIENLPKKKISIYSIDILSYNNQEKTVKLRVHCTGGTYIRSFINDLGIKLSTYAYVEELRRLRSGPFSIADTTNLDTATLDYFIDILTFLKNNIKKDIQVLDGMSFQKILQNKKILNDTIVIANNDKKEFLIYNNGVRIFI